MSQMPNSNYSTSALVLTLALIISACQPEPTNAPPFFALIETPSQAGGESNLFLSEEGNIYLSWVEYADDSTDVLQFTKWMEKGWGPAKEIGRGKDWFVNWADFPSLITYQDNEEQIAAHWLQKSDIGVYDYDVRIAQSTDGGENWSNSFVLHQDSVAAEHGFVSMLPIGRDRVFASWLDGRYTKTNDGPMTLRAGVFNGKGELLVNTELDGKVCECCQTAAVQTEKGLLVAYRDRWEGEIRDISIVKRRRGQWSPPIQIVADNWEIAGCPVNGPALASNGLQVALAWYTEAQDSARVQLVSSLDAGETWSAVTQIDEGSPLGRVDVQLLSNGEILVLWLEDRPARKEADIMVKRLGTNGQPLATYKLTTTSSARASGFPRMACPSDTCWLSWTQVIGKDTKVQTAKFVP